MSRIVVVSWLALFLAQAPRPLAAQAAGVTHDSARVQRSGPRFGILVLSDAAKRKAGLSSAFTTVFAWQAELDFASQPDGVSGVTALIPALAGVEQRAFLPSITWIIGFRTPGGFEAGVGPDLSFDGTALAVAAGYTARSGTLNIPFNLGVTPGASGVRVSFTTGFNAR